ncbi:MAG: GDP-mannose 4,6-dehydratase [Bacteriovoracales bacterium]|nr:GDP-mannose 4,6-dehydratase [Bacteriovoracales bacterium]
MNSHSPIFPESYDQKVFLVAGAAGFVPGSVSEFYLQKGGRVIGLDNFVTGQRANIERLKKYPKFSFIECDIGLGIPDLREQKIDYILNLASPASPVDFYKIPLEIMRVNSQGTTHLLSLARESGARFLEASTSEVYGDPEIHPQKETYLGRVNSLGPRGCYDESKRFAEALTMSFHRHFGVETRIVRIFNTYGPGMRADDGRVIPNFVSQALTGADLTVYGDGRQTRSFCFVSDLVEGIHNVLFSGDPMPFNVGNPDEYTIMDCARFVIEALGSSSRIVHRELPEDDPQRRRPDLTRLEKLCDFRPKVGLREGIERTARYFKDLS